MVEKLIHLKSETEGTPHVYKENSFNDVAMVLFQPDQPWIEGESNYQQQLTARLIRMMVRTIIGRSTLLGSLAPSETGIDNEVRLHTQNQPFHVAIDGILKTVYAYDDPVSDTPSEGGNRVRLPDYAGGAARSDLVYLEVWFEEVMPEGGRGTADTTVFRHGMEHGFTEPNTIRVERVPELRETSRRVQVRGRVRSVAGKADLTLLPARDNAAFTFNSFGGVWLAGDGDESSAKSLGTVDGYVYAIPLLRVVRGATASAYTELTVLPSTTATLQELADVALNDLTTISGTLNNIEQTLGTQAGTLSSHGTRLGAAEGIIENHDATIESLNRQGQSHSRSIRNERRRYTFDGDAAAFSGTYGQGRWPWGMRVLFMPANHRLILDKVIAGLPRDTRFSLEIRSLATNLARTWTWTPVSATVGWYNEFQILSRTHDGTIIELPEFDRNAEQGLRITTFFDTLIPSVYLGQRNTYGQPWWWHLEFFLEEIAQ